ncbi:MAG: hypothetical protein ABJA20_09060, partial [Novosphingobium sp.]
ESDITPFGNPECRSRLGETRKDGLMVGVSQKEIEWIIPDFLSKVTQAGPIRCPLRQAPATGSNRRYFELFRGSEYDEKPIQPYDSQAKAERPQS